MTKYENIVQHINAMIAGNQLTPGKRTPSIRSLAEEFSCSNETVIKAYKFLEQDHVLYSKPRSGYYLVDKQIFDHATLNPIKVSSSYPDDQLFPHDHLAHSIHQAIKIYKKELFRYPHSHGLPELINTMQKLLQDFQIFVDKKNLFITTGVQLALNIISKMPFPNGKDIILLEQPTYYGAIKAFEINQQKMMGIPRNLDSFNLDALEEIFKNHPIKFFYSTSRNHNPLGIPYSKKEKEGIVRLAEKYDVYIIEDDYMADYNIYPNDLPLWSFDRSNRVFYIKTFSKILLPSMRVGLAVVPDQFVELFNNHRRWTDMNSNIISQGAMDIFVKSGMFETHRQFIRKLHVSRMEKLKNVLTKHASDDIVFTKPDYGYFLTVYSKKDLNYDNLMLDLQKNNMVTIDTRLCFLEAFKTTRYFRFSVSQMSEEIIETKVPVILDLIKKNIVMQ
jgi:DNA-binding transcriptional MocR family regulator